MGISILREKGEGSISVYFLYLLLMVPLWVVNAIEVTPLPSNGALMGSNGLTVWLGNHLKCLLILNDSISPSSVVNPFTRHRTLLRLGRQYVRQYYQLPPSFYGRHDTSRRS